MKPMTTNRKLMLALMAAVHPAVSPGNRNLAVEFLAARFLQPADEVRHLARLSVKMPSFPNIERWQELAAHLETARRLTKSQPDYYEKRLPYNPPARLTHSADKLFERWWNKIREKFWGKIEGLVARLLGPPGLTAWLY